MDKRKILTGRLNNVPIYSNLVQQVNILEVDPPFMCFSFPSEARLVNGPLTFYRKLFKFLISFLLLYGVGILASISRSYANVRIILGSS